MRRDGLIADISVALNNMHVPVHSFVAKELKVEKTGFQVTISINDVSQYNFITSNLKKVQGVLSIERLSM